MKFQIARGKAAHGLLADEPFLHDWNALAQQCAWTTAFQRKDFAKAWYHAYRRRFEPVLAMLQDDANRLRALLPLALDPRGNLVAVGAWQSEYQGWISDPAIDADQFLLQAVRELRREFSGARIMLRYLAPGSPTGWIQQLQSDGTALVQMHGRPLLRFGDGSRTRASLQKRGNRRRLRSLELLGPVEFRQITDKAELLSMFNLAVQWHDARSLALRGLAPFASDDCKYDLHVAMMETPDLLHATALVAGERPVSVHLNIREADHLQLWFIAHDPCQAQHSPGKLHVLMLSKMLHDQGMQYLDLTPGDDVYKSRFATDVEQVHEVTLYASANRRRIASIVRNAEELTKRTLRRRGISPASALCVAARARPSEWMSYAIRRMCQSLVRPKETILLSRNLDAPQLTELDHEQIVRRNSLSDLLAYQPRNGLPRSEFLAESFRRIEEGYHVYTCVQAGKLVHWSWMCDEPDLAQRHLCGASLPSNSGMIFDMYTVGCARRRGVASAVVLAVLRDCLRDSRLKRLYFSVRPTNHVALSIAARLGFASEEMPGQRRSVGRLPRQFESRKSRPAAEFASHVGTPPATGFRTMAMHAIQPANPENGNHL
jgi:CelD/BcsL family acetyltransferase involved in cellulose biosynthesis/GNAT superfamily N-acetyltransferase